MKYQITITKTEEVKTLGGSQWVVVDQRPWTEDELGEPGTRLYSSSIEDFLKANPLKKVMGYTPQIETTKTVETEILKQIVDELDFAAVIKAINFLV